MKLILDDGVVDLAALTASRAPKARKLSAHLRLGDRGSRWRLETLLVALFELGAKGLDAYTQVVHLCAQVIEDYLRTHEPDVQMDGNVAVVLGPRRGVRQHARIKESMLDAVKKLVASRMAERRLQYFWASRKAFSGQQDLSIAIDASRQGQKNVVSGVVGKADNVCALAPPQVVARIGIASHRHWCVGAVFVSKAIWVFRKMRTV